ncbi:MAG: amidohydrolase [Saprospiraceae bacterium]|nr:amidohydrolase [Saprospiraceae bacterium]
MKATPTSVHDLVDLRKTLHRTPELSGQEIKTAACIRAFVARYRPDKMIEHLGGTGLACIYEYGQGGPTVVFRCELDALPIQETNGFSHASLVKGVSHKCGHDGHMCMVAGLAPWLQQQSFGQGRIVLLFQPSEETGQGAQAVTSDPRFVELQPNFVFALHNIPGEPLHSIQIMDQRFSAEVISFLLRLVGKESHASSPELGNNPAQPLATIVDRLSRYEENDPHSRQFSLLTPIHIRMGEVAYGISPGEAELHYTLRAWDSAVLEQTKVRTISTIEQICRDYGVHHQIHWLEYFPSSPNDPESNRLVEDAAQELGLTVMHPAHPFRFGEDFGWYSRQWPCAMFGIGAGTSASALHAADYDFPDELLSTGISLFQQIILKIFL